MFFRCYERFRKLENERRNPHYDYEARIDIGKIIEGFEELKYNPFAWRMCQVFSSL